MRRRTQSWYQSKNAKSRRESLMRRSRKGVEARARKRMETSIEREPKMVCFHPLEFCVRNKLSGQMSEWHELRSVRRIAKQAGLLLKFCT